MTAPQFPTDRGYPEPSQATTALVLGILGIPMSILAPFAWITASREIAAIHEGRRDPEGLQLATTARILGIIGTVLMAAGLIVLFVLVVLIGAARFAF